MCHERGQRWRDGVSCPLLDNKPPQNVMAWNNEQLLSPFPWPQWVGLAESRVRLQTRGWLVPHHQQARLGTRSVFRITHRLPQAEGLLAVDPTGRCLGVPTASASLSQVGPLGEESGKPPCPLQPGLRKDTSPLLLYSVPWE